MSDVPLHLLLTPDFVVGPVEIPLPPGWPTESGSYHWLQSPEILPRVRRLEKVLGTDSSQVLANVPVRARRIDDIDTCWDGLLQIMFSWSTDVRGAPVISVGLVSSETPHGPTWDSEYENEEGWYDLYLPLPNGLSAYLGARVLDYDPTVVYDPDETPELIEESYLHPIFAQWLHELVSAYCTALADLTLEHEATLAALARPALLAARFQAREGRR